MRFYLWVCALSGFFELVVSYNADTIIIPDPGRLAREINSVQKSWVAVDYYGRPVTYADVEERLGARMHWRSFSRSPISFSSNYNSPPASGLDLSNIQKIQDDNMQHLLPKIPRSLDLRKFYPHCKSLTTIRDQSSCGSCWAVSSANVFSDRLCIATNGKINVQISAESLVTCCKKCGNGCDGGFSEETFKHFMEDGEITGGDFGSEYGCKPYSIPPESDTATMDIAVKKTSNCADKCTNPKHPTSLEMEKRYKTKNFYKFPDANVTKIQWDLMLNGPLVASFSVYTDFMLYRSGVYRHTKGFNAGAHSVRLLGWGRENGVDYWLLANSWNTTWGNQGTFKMRRGANECFLEENIVGGEPDLKHL